LLDSLDSVSGDSVSGPQRKYAADGVAVAAATSMHRATTPAVITLLIADNRQARLVLGALR
jgi:hypothetical protein